MVRLQLAEEAQVDALRNFVVEVPFTPEVPIINDLVVEGLLGFVKIAQVPLPVVKLALAD